MTTYTGPDRTYSAGVPSQGSDSFAVTPEGLISGEYPTQFVQDIQSAASQTLAAYTVVGYDQNKRIVKATNDVVAAVAATGTAVAISKGCHARTSSTTNASHRPPRGGVPDPAPRHG